MKNRNDLIRQSNVLQFIKFTVQVQDPNDATIVNAVDIHTGALLSAAHLVLETEPKFKTYEEAQAEAMLKMFEAIENNFIILRVIQSV